jgi:hypothetical protein
LTVGCEACRGTSGAGVETLGVVLPVDGVVRGELEVGPDDEPDCEVEGELEPAGAPLGAGERSLPVWNASPVRG